MTQKQPYFDLARGLAAILVLAGHLRAFVFVDYARAESHNPLVIVFYALTGLGHQAVMIFFVLSGFLIGKSVHTASMQNRWTWKRYAVQRLVRLWIVLIPALILTALFDAIGSVWVQPDFYSGAMNDLFSSGPPLSNGGADWGASTFIANSLFLQTIIAPTFGSNGPLWSLANEFWYYLLFPLAYFAVRGVTAAWARLAYALAFVAISLWLPRGLVLGGAIWLLGYCAWLAADAAARSPRLRLILHLIGPVLFFLALLYSKTAQNNPFLSDALVGLAFAIWIVPLSVTNIAPGGFTRLVHGLADMSYTLYLTHFPFVALTVLWLLHGTQFQPTPVGFAIYAILLVSAVAFGAIVWWVFERRTKQLQKALLGVVERSPATVPRGGAE